VDKNPLDILVYAARHDYSDLLDKAAALVIGQPLDAVIDRMPPAIALVWIRYYQKWRGAYAKAVTRPTECNCSNWDPRVVVPILDKFGGKVEWLVKLDEVFQPAGSINACCSNHMRNWRNHVIAVCDAIPKFSTLI
jgi:hypothetical protein